MIRRNFHQRLFRRAFSLIELIVVVAILGTIIGVALPQWQKAASVKALEKRNANLRTLNITGDRVSLQDQGYWVDTVAGSNWVPAWPLLFKDPIPTTDETKRERAEDVVGYFFDEGYLPGHLRGSLDLSGIGYEASGYFVPVAMD
jgi:prepilin-type N-terminal cleavage/methylation domain-containing protein